MESIISLSGREIVLNSSALTKNLQAESQAKSLKLNFWAGIAATKENFNWFPKINLFGTLFARSGVAYIVLGLAEEILVVREESEKYPNP